MIDIVDEKEIRNKLSTKGCIWINHDYMRDGELARKEFFLKKTNFGYGVGFDEYLDKHEDAIDLYEAYVRQDFECLKDAITYCVSQLSISVSEILEA